MVVPPPRGFRSLGELGGELLRGLSKPWIWLASATTSESKLISCRATVEPNRNFVRHGRSTTSELSLSGFRVWEFLKLKRDYARHVVSRINKGFQTAFPKKKNNNSKKIIIPWLKAVVLVTLPFHIVRMALSAGKRVLAALQVWENGGNFVDSSKQKRLRTLHTFPIFSVRSNIFSSLIWKAGVMFLWEINLFSDKINIKKVSEPFISPWHTRNFDTKTRFSHTS